MIGFLVRGRVRVNIRIRVRVKIRIMVGVTFSVSGYHWSKLLSQEQMSHIQKLLLTYKNLKCF